MAEMPKNVTVTIHVDVERDEAWDYAIGRVARDEAQLFHDLGTIAADQRDALQDLINRLADGLVITETDDGQYHYLDDELLAEMRAAKKESD